MELHTGERHEVLPIPVFIGISERFRVIEGLTERSIRAHTSNPVDIQHVYPAVEEGCTGFSNVRYQIRYGIYLDPDMIVLGDIAELWSYHRPGKFVCMADEAFRLEPGAAGGIYIKGAKQADNKYVSVSDIGDFIHLVADGNGDWVAVASISGADADITVQP